MRKRLKNYTCTGDEKARAADLVDKYSGMSEDALYARLMQEVASARSNGTFSAAELAENVARMRSYLTKEQAEKLDHLLRIIGG